MNLAEVVRQSGIYVQDLRAVSADVRLTAAPEDSELVGELSGTLREMVEDCAEVGYRLETMLSLTGTDLGRAVATVCTHYRMEGYCVNPEEDYFVLTKEGYEGLLFIFRGDTSEGENIGVILVGRDIQ